MKEGSSSLRERYSRPSSERFDHAAAEALLGRHLEHNVLGDSFTEDSFVIEPVHHLALLEPGLVSRHIEEVMTTFE